MLFCLFLLCNLLLSNTLIMIKKLITKSVYFYWLPWLPDIQGLCNLVRLNSKTPQTENNEPFSENVYQ